jgi:hypothetical protein
VLDVLLVAVIVAFFVLAALLVQACAGITAPTDFELEEDAPTSESVR